VGEHPKSDGVRCRRVSNVAQGLIELKCKQIFAQNYEAVDVNWGEVKVEPHAPVPAILSSHTVRYRIAR